jgi:predicted RNA-binding protein YlqC (UPF0109 family)
MKKIILLKIKIYHVYNRLIIAENICFFLEGLDFTPIRRDKMKELIQRIVEALVNKPGEISINILNTRTTYVIELKVAKDDIGKIIGKEGNIASAIRTILSNVAAKERKKIILQILE